MALKEMSLAEVLERTSGTQYFPVFVQLVGKTNDLLLYRGITKEDAHYIEELEDQLGWAIGSNYIEFLQVTNGGIMAGMKFYSLDNKENVDSLYYRNFKTDTRKKLKLSHTSLIIGEYENGVITFDTDEDDEEGSFTLMDIYNKERLDFAFLEDLITFRFYFRLIEAGKKKQEEKEKLKLAKKKLHDQIVKENKARKIASEKARMGITKRSSKETLAKMEKKAKR